MSRRGVASWTLVAAAVAAVVVLAVAGVRAAHEIARHAYWSDGLRRLCVALVTDGTDRAASWAVVPVIAAGLFAPAAFRRAPAPAVRRAALVVLVVALGLRAGAAIDRRFATRGRPNVLLISIDTLRADRLGSYGNDRGMTPVLDRRLAAEGVTFERVFSQSPKTTPSHMTMFTSLAPCVHGVDIWDGRSLVRNLNPRVRTLAEVLRNAGYTTTAFTGGAHMMGARGLANGFEDFVEGDGRELGPAARWIKHHRRERWFLLFHSFEVHDPYVPPADLEERFASGYAGTLKGLVERLRRGTREWNDRHHVFWSGIDRSDPATVGYLRGLYDAGVAQMDRMTLPTLLDTLDGLQLTRDTLVIFTSDHGEAFGEHGRFLHDDLHATTTHVPLVLRWPGRLPAARRIGAVAGLVDLMPTILDLLDVPGPPAMQGRSLVPLVEGTAPAASPAVPSEYRDPIERVAWREPGFAYLVDGESVRLFDTVADPGENEDLAARQPAAVARLATAVARWRTECHDLALRFGPTEPTAMPHSRTIDQLRALGYVE